MNGRLIAIFEGGLGNQLFSYAFARYVANRYQRTLVLDDTMYWLNKTGRAWWMDDFEMSAKTPRSSKTDKLRLLFSYAVRRSLGGKVGDMCLACCHAKWHGQTALDEPVLNEGILADRSKDVYIPAYHFSMNCMPPREQLQQELVPKNLSAAVRNYAKMLNREHTVSIHIRRGDYLGHPGPLRPLPLSYYQDAVRILYGMHKGLKFYVFSDDLAWCRGALSFLPMSEVAFVDVAETPVEDLYLMSCCQHHIIANSTFSWWGAYLSQRDGLTLYPRPWQGGGNDPSSKKSFIPTGWQPIDSGL